MKKENEELENMEIRYIGDELKFQRLYYNCTHDIKIELGDCNATGNYEVLGVELAEYLYKNGIIQKEKINGVSEKVLMVIEESNYKIYEDTCKWNNSSVQSPSTHYFEMYYMFKRYGYLDDYDIFKIFEKYDILHEIKKEKEYREVLSNKTEILLHKIEEYRQTCKLEYEKNNKKMFTDLEQPIIVDIKAVESLLNECSENTKFLINKKYLEGIINYHRQSSIQISLNKLKKIMLENFKKLSEFQKKCVSLDIGKEKGFINDMLNSSRLYITLETTQKVLKYLDLQNSDIYYFITKKIEEDHIQVRKSMITKAFDNI